MVLELTKRWIHFIKKQPLKHRLLTIISLFLVILVGAISFYGLHYTIDMQKNASHQKYTDLQNNILSLSLIAEQDSHDSVPNYHQLIMYAHNLTDMKQVWITDSKNNILFYLNDPEPAKLNADFKSSVKMIFYGINAATYSRVNPYFLYCVPLSNGNLLLMATSQNSMEVPNYYIFYFINTGILIIISFFIFLLFNKHVYYPIRSIERAISGIADAEMDFETNVPENNELYPMSQDINTMTQKMREVLNREYNSNILRKQSEINALQSQINPHFLFNTLDSIRGQAIVQGSFEIANLLKSLSEIFQYSISRTSNLVTLAREFQHMDNYLTIQQYRFNNKFDVEKHFDGDQAQLLSCKIPKLTIQPIVENAVFHGLETQKGKGKISFYIYSTEKRLIIEIEDNGVGMDTLKLNKLNQSLISDVDFTENPEGGHRHNSIALKNVNQRIRLLYGDDYGLKVFSTIGIGTMVQITIPIIN